MKKISLIIAFIAYCLIGASAQQVSLNETTKIYEYSHVQEYTGELTERLNIFSYQLKQLNYANIMRNENDVSGNSFFSKLIMGSAMEVHYQAFVQLKEGRYKLTINKFSIKDQRYGEMPIENLKKKSQERWLALINENIPDIVSNIENTKNTDNW